MRRYRGGAAGHLGVQTWNRACRCVEGEKIQILHRDVSCVGDATGSLTTFRAKHEVEDPGSLIL